MKASRPNSRQARRIHRWLVPIAAAPLLITAGTGSLYSLLLEQNIDAQAGPHDRGLITPMPSLRAGAAAGATAMTGLVVGMTGGTGF